VERGIARHRQARQVTLHVRDEHRDSPVGELLGKQLQRPCLTGAGCCGNEAMAVGHREWQPDLGLPVNLLGGIECGAEGQCRLVARVPRRQHFGKCGHGCSRGCHSVECSSTETTRSISPAVL
jgi:hypothetical protein